MSNLLAKFLNDDTREQLLRRLGRALLISAPFVILLQVLIIAGVVK